MKPILHPACAEWPKMTALQIEELARDIAQNGQLEAITLMADGSLLDGSNRWDACEKAGIEPRTVIYEGDDPISFVISKNKLRRHMEIEALALITAKLITLKKGETPHSFVKRMSTREALATKAGISITSIDKAQLILKRGTPDVIAMVKKGEVGLTVAADAVSAKSKEQQQNWTKEDVKREGHKVRDARPSAQRRKAVTKKVDLIKPTVGSIKFPTFEETGFPVNGTMAEKDAHYRKYGRTPLHPKAVKDMLNHEASVTGYIMAILSFTNEIQPDAATFFASLEAMSQWVRQPEKGSDWGIDFARKAKQQLALLRERLPTLLKRAEELSILLPSTPQEISSN